MAACLFAKGILTQNFTIQKMFFQGVLQIKRRSHVTKQHYKAKARQDSVTCNMLQRHTMKRFGSGKVPVYPGITGIAKHKGGVKSHELPAFNQYRSFQLDCDGYQS
eukprot:2360571-Amphidinium_carterae.1